MSAFTVFFMCYYIYITFPQQNDGSITDLMQQMLFHSKKHESMTDREIVAQGLTFLLAGYETTSAVLAFHCHVLAKNPEAQRRLRKEIKALGNVCVV